MKTKEEIIYRHDDALAVPSKLQTAGVDAFAKWDSFDLGPLAMIPHDVMGNFLGAKTQDEAVELFSQGARGKTGRSALAKDVEISRRLARYVQTMLTVHLDQYSHGKSSERKIRLLDGVLDKAHRRMLAGYEMLLRLEAGPTPMFKVTADTAAFQFNTQAPT